jgi:hypothetical protein
MLSKESFYYELGSGHHAVTIVGISLPLGLCGLWQAAVNKTDRRSIAV